MFFMQGIAYPKRSLHSPRSQPALSVVCSFSTPFPRPIPPTSLYVVLLTLKQLDLVQSNRNSMPLLLCTLPQYIPSSPPSIPLLALQSVSRISSADTDKEKDNITSIEPCTSKIANCKDSHLIRDLLHLLSDIEEKYRDYDAGDVNGSTPRNQNLSRSLNKNAYQHSCPGNQPIYISTHEGRRANS